MSLGTRATCQEVVSVTCPALSLVAGFVFRRALASCLVSVLLFASYPVLKTLAAPSLLIADGSQVTFILGLPATRGQGAPLPPSLVVVENVFLLENGPARQIPCALTGISPMDLLCALRSSAWARLGSACLGSAWARHCACA